MIVRLKHQDIIMCLIVTIIMSYLAIANLIAGNLVASLLQGLIALLFLALLIRNIYMTIEYKKGCSSSGCKITDAIAGFFKRGRDDT